MYRKIQYLFDERERINIKGGGKRKSLEKEKFRAASINSKNKAAQKIQRDISSLKAKCKELEGKRSTSREEDENEGNAGNQFGGCKGNKQKKRYE